ncbi:MAG: cell envelope integrity protein CreD [Thermodesulfobacteriota bacterium]
MNESKLKSSVTLRMVVMGMVVLFLLILAATIRALIFERQQRRDEAIHEVSQKWGNIQTITGPVLTLPFRKPTKDEKGKTVFYTDCLHIMPEILQAEVDLIPEIRYRGIYQAVLYQAAIKLKGKLILPQLEKYDLLPEHLILKEAFITVGITDLRGIKNAITLDWGGEKLSASPGVKSSNISKSGFTVFPVVDLSRSEYAFSVDLRLNGSGEFNIIPVGKETLVTTSSKWNSPSFIGNFLPEKREISPSGFRATWNIQHLNRNFPQTWVGNAYCLANSAFGVKLLQPVDEYQKVTRAVKYAIMFIVLTFMAFFLTEIFSRAAIHPIQYTLIGLAIILFYVILLSLSEHIPFNLSYVTSSAGVILLISAYAKSVLKTRRVAVVIGGTLTTLYLFLFVTLQLEDYALLLGSIGLFVILATIMFLTRRIDWFDIGGIGNGQRAFSSKKENGVVDIQK